MHCSVRMLVSAADSFSAVALPYNPPPLLLANFLWSYTQLRPSSRSKVVQPQMGSDVVLQAGGLIPTIPQVSLISGRGHYGLSFMSFWALSCWQQVTLVMGAKARHRRVGT